MSVVTRFAPSPTGFLHIGGARTALFNWLYARHHGGKFLLRIEDTDRERSTEEAVNAIIDGLSWLGLEWDGEPVRQSARATEHAEIAQKLLAEGKAYLCYSTPEDLTQMREQARRSGRPVRYDGQWRDRDASEAPQGVPPVIRFKAPQTGETAIEDLVQGTVSISNAELDDMVLLRADGTPTYMLSVVADDRDMGITHVIRGDDHLTNAFRQIHLFRALDWEPPRYAHIPLIHGAEGAKLSKRHGALAVEAYREMGFLAQALRNYLLRLGWSHGDEEVIETEQAIEWFGLEAIGRSPARFDAEKLKNLNGVYIRRSDDKRLVRLIAPGLEKRLRGPLGDDRLSILERAMAGLKQRAKTIEELSENAYFYVADRPLILDRKAAKLVAGREAKARLSRLKGELEGLPEWSEGALEGALRQFAESEGVGLGKVAQPLRSALTGASASPGIFEVLAILGREQVIGRLADALKAKAPE